MDVTRFALLRPPRQAEPDHTVRLETALTLPVIPGRVVAGEPVTEFALRIETVPDAVGSTTVDPTLRTAGADASLLQRQYALLHDADQELRRHGDRVSMAHLKKLVAALTREHDVGASKWTQAFGFNMPGLSYATALIVLRQRLEEDMTALEPRMEHAMRLTRMVLVAATLRDALLAGFKLPKEIATSLCRPVVLAGTSQGQLAPAAKVLLIREAKVTDLHVVRREWAGYITGEVASIRNLMAGESYTQRDLTATEVENTTETTEERRESSSREDESRLESDFTEEINTQLAISINGHAEGAAEFNYPMMTAQISGGIEAGLTMQRSERRASEIAKEAVTRAASQIDTLNRKIRTRRDLYRTEQAHRYQVENTGAEHQHAIYRWVDRIDNYQKFWFPQRFQLEFQIPEPAEFYRWRTQQAASTAAAANAPPAWDVDLSTLTIDKTTDKKLAELATTYGATNLPAVPRRQIGISRTLSVDATKAAPPPGDEHVLNAPVGQGEVEIAIPADYAATKVQYEGQAFPLLGNIFKETVYADGNQYDKEFTGLRSSFATVAVAGKTDLFFNGGWIYKSANAADDGWLSSSGADGAHKDVGRAKVEMHGPPPFGRAILPIGTGFGIDPEQASVDVVPPAADLLKAAVSIVGASSATVTFHVTCDLTEEAQTNWKLAVHDALYAAWVQWSREYAATQAALPFLPASGLDPGSSQRNDLTIREELKRQVIGWLLTEEGFAGRPAMKPRPAQGTPTSPAPFADPDFVKSQAGAPTIQFLEQAFEWSNLSWVFYPYYWAGRAQWNSLSNLTANDPEFERFLRSGSARVILPARPGFETAVRNWLLYQKPFLTGSLPGPDEAMYVSIDAEIQDLTSPPVGGIAGDHWWTRTSTTMIHLEKDGQLPLVNQQAQVPAPSGQPFTPSHPILSQPAELKSRSTTSRASRSQTAAKKGGKTRAARTQR